MHDIKFNDNCVHLVFLGLPNVPGIAAEIFGELSKRSIEVETVTQNTMRGGRSDLSFLVNKNRLDELISLCRGISERIGGQGVSFMTEVASITVKIDNPSDSARTLAKIFKALAEVNVNIEIINSVSDSVSCVVSLTHALEGLNSIKTIFQE